MVKMEQGSMPEIFQMAWAENMSSISKAIVLG